MQFLPSPENPGLQVQLYDPFILLHTASAPHLFVPEVHSSTSGKYNISSSIFVFRSAKAFVSLYTEVLMI